MTNHDTKKTTGMYIGKYFMTDVQWLYAIALEPVRWRKYLNAINETHTRWGRNDKRSKKKYN